jgi:hypothetical protein
VLDFLGGADALGGVVLGGAAFGGADALGAEGALGGSLKEVNFVLSKVLAPKAGLVAESNFF